MSVFQAQLQYGALVVSAFVGSGAVVLLYGC